MAEFCLDCYNKMNNMCLVEKDVILSEYIDLCEGCAKYKHIIISYKKRKKIKHLLQTRNK